MFDIVTMLKSKVSKTDMIYCGNNTIEVFIGRLRKKLGMNLIKTERGYGYRLSVDKE